MNIRATVLGMALSILGIFIPFVGWFFLLPVGLIITVAGLIMKEEPARVKPAAAEPAMSPEELLLEADLVTSEMTAIARKLPELSNKAKTSAELADQYANALKDAESKVGLAGHLQDSLIQTIEKVKQELPVTESAVFDLERSREVYGVQAESLEAKMAQERARLDKLEQDVEKWESMLHELRFRRKHLADLVTRELGSHRPEEIGLYFKVLMRYKEKYGETAEKKLRRDLSLGGRRLEELYTLMCSEETP